MASESAPERRKWFNHKITTATRTMAVSLSNKKGTPIIIPGDLSSTNACVLEPLYDDEPADASELETAIALPAVPAMQISRSRFLGHLFKYPYNNVFECSPKQKIKSQPGRGSKSKKKKMMAQDVLPGFLDLPVEIRNQIFGYIFHQRLVTIKQNDAWPYQKDSPLVDALTEYREPDLPKATKSLRIVNNTKKDPAALELKLKKARGVSYDRIPGQTPLSREGVIWETSMSSLLLTCSTFEAEAGPILYGATTFYFDDAQRLRAFLKTVSRVNLSCITRLHVHVRTYGIPTKAADNIWEEEHIKCWTSIFAKIAKKMTNLHAMRVSLTMRSMTDSLKRAFKPIRNNTDWKKRSGYMLMLQPLSRLSKLKDLRVTVKATDYQMQQFQEVIPHLIWNYWILANIHPVAHLQDRVVALHQKIFDELHHGLEKGMMEVGRSKKADKSFAPVALAVHEYIAFGLDPVGYMLMKDHESK